MDIYDFERIVKEMLEKAENTTTYTDLEEERKQGRIAAYEDLLDRLDESKG